jgi:DNA polymerase III subunit epsilon
MIKQLFFDVETTGLDPNRNAIIEIGGIIRTSAIQVEFGFFAQPFPTDVVEDAALKVNGFTREEIAELSPPKETHAELVQLFSEHIDKYSKRDKFFAYGWNVDFDDRFLRAFFRKCEDKYYGSFILWPPVNVAALATEMLGEERFNIADFHLHTAAEYLGIKVDYEKRHTAKYDAELTMKVYDHIQGLM